MLKPQSLAATLVACDEARQNCKRTGNIEGEAMMTERVKQLMELLPSGSGVDNGTKIESIGADKIVLTCGFHHMDDVGGYNSWTYHTITVRPSWSGISITVTGKNRNEIKEYLGELYYQVLSGHVMWFEEVGRYGEVVS